MNSLLLQGVAVRIVDEVSEIKDCACEIMKREQSKASGFEQRLLRDAIC